MTSRSSEYDPSALDAYANDHAGQVYLPDQQCEESFGTGYVLYRVCIQNYIIFVGSLDLLDLWAYFSPEGRSPHDFSAPAFPFRCFLFDCVKYL